ncbi:MAG: D-amino-acid transaminase [Bacillota bacterium]|nr:D-amino-acid transaminase [Bacillota bacterium]
MEFVLLNGEIIERSDAKIDVEDRGYQFGDGVYEVIRVYNGSMFTSEEHLARFRKSAEAIGIKLNFTIEEISAFLNQLIEKNNVVLGTVYLQITRGTSPRNHAFPSPGVPTNIVAYTKEVARPVENMKSGVKAMLIEDIRWLRCDIKSLNLLGNLLAKQEAVEAGCFEAIQHRGQTVTEGSSSNILMIKEGKIITHPADNLILNGITKRKLQEICIAAQIPFEERSFTIDEISQADEILLTSTTAEIMPIVEVNGKAVNEGIPGTLTKRLQELFETEIEKQCGELTIKI